jgi:hypothetical protein
MLSPTSTGQHFATFLESFHDICARRPQAVPHRFAKHEDTIMDHLASISAVPTTQRAQNAQTKPPIALGVLGGALMVIAVAVLPADAALAPEQRIAVFMQTGNFP